MNGQLHISSMTREERILKLIKDVDANPYTISKRKAVSKYHLMPATVEVIIERLNLEIIGYKANNDRREIETFIMNNPKLPAEQIMKQTGFSNWLVYGVARDMGVRFETKHTIKKNKPSKFLYKK